MRILLATSTVVPKGGGIASYNVELLKEFQNDHSFDLLVDSNDLVKGFDRVISTYSMKLHSYNSCRKIVNEVNNNKYDIIINSRSSIIPYISPFLNAPIISIAHFINGIQADNSAYNSKYVNKIIAQSTYCKAHLIRKFRIADYSKVEVVHNFVPKSEERWSSDKLDTPLITIVYPGGTAIHKSSDIVISTVNKLINSDLNFKFIWLGGTILPSAHLSLFGVKNINTLIRKDSRVLFTGKVSREEAIKYIETANIFLLPSRGEGCPMTLLEAMRKGCIPIISDSRHGSLDIIHKCKAGIVVKQGSSRQLYNAIRNVIEGHENYHKIYQMTYDFSQSYLSQSRWSTQMNNILLSALNSVKIQKTMNYLNFYLSLVPWRVLQFVDRVKSVTYSIYVRLKMDAYYLMWKSK